MSTPEQHEALFLEILGEMTAEQLADAMKPVDFEAEIRIDLEPEPRSITMHELALQYRIANAFNVSKTLAFCA